MIHYRTLRERAEAARWRRFHKAEALIRAAGCCDAGHGHNAQVSRDYGKAWPRVDYAKLDSGMRLMHGQFRATAWLSALYTRLGPFAFNFEA
jgi:hypothetical protein